ncbi:MAG: hypothetical protein O3C40_17975 [Planctomycetota bacterium]|nr:hypothetical protein [Planctomycetota bacterium]
MADDYVDVQNGDDANTGMVNDPWKTIGHSVDKLLEIANVTSSHKVFVLPGVYHEAITIPPDSRSKRSNSSREAPVTTSSPAGEL